MGKILEKEFRNELYKNLCEAGYEKQEAQKIVSVKYCDVLKGKLMESLHTQIASIEFNYFFKKLEKYSEKSS